MPAGGLVTAGIVTGLAKGISGLVGASKMKSLMKTMPTAQRSQYAGQQLGTSQMELNSNPFLASQNRAIANRQANMMSGAQQNVTDPSMMLAMVGNYGAMAADESYKNDQNNYGQRSQRLQDLYGAQRANQAEDGRMDQARASEFAAKAGLQNNINQSTTNSIGAIGDGVASGLSMGQSAKLNTAQTNAYNRYMGGGGGGSSSLADLLKIARTTSITSS